MSENIGTFLANVEKWSQSSELCLYSPSGEGLVKEGRKEGRDYKEESSWTKLTREGSTM